jgi:elongator complex protein 2
MVANGFTGALHVWQRQTSAPSVLQAATRSGMPQGPLTFELEPSSLPISQPVRSSLLGGLDGHVPCPHESCHAATTSTILTGSSSPLSGALVPVPSAVGHCGCVVDACWGGDGQCLFTVSTDQTLRVTVRDVAGHWFEFARPQVHGHDFHALASIPQPGRKGRFMYASASEEKVIRVFLAPRTFVQSLALLRGHAGEWEDEEGGPLGATIPALGLSNKAVEEGHEARGAGAGEAVLGYESGPDLAPNSVPAVIEVCPVCAHCAWHTTAVAPQRTASPAMSALQRAHRVWVSKLVTCCHHCRMKCQAWCACEAVSEEKCMQGQPLEETLSQSTLWPEVHKLYGHGNDVFTLAACPLGTALVSASKAQSATTAAVRVWDCRHPDFVQCQTLPGHKLTVTELRFSEDGRFLLSASRDRSVCVYQALHLKNGVPVNRRFTLSDLRDQTLHAWSSSSIAVGPDQCALDSQ